MLKIHSYHYSDVISSTMTSQTTGVSIAYSTVCSGAEQRNHQSSASLIFVRRIHRWPVNSPHKGSATRKLFPFDDVIMIVLFWCAFMYIFPSLSRYNTYDWNKWCHVVLGKATKAIRCNVFRNGLWLPGGRLNKKDGLTRYGNSHVKDKTS